MRPKRHVRHQSGGSSNNPNGTITPANLAHDVATGYNVRERLPDCRRSISNLPDGRNVPLPIMAPPSIHEPSLANCGFPWQTPRYGSEGPIDPSNQEANRPLRPSTSRRQSESFRLLDKYGREDFLSPDSLTLTASPMWLPSSPPVHRVATPIPPRAHEPTTPRASPRTQNLEHLPSPMPSPHLFPQGLGPPPLFTSFQEFYPRSAQPLVQVDRATLSPALPNVEIDWDRFGPLPRSDNGSNLGLSDTLSDLEFTPNDHAGVDPFFDGTL